MKSYVKPIVLENEELAEGIYAASGDVEEPSVPGETPSEPPEGGSSNPEGENPPTNEQISGIEGDCWTVVVEPEQRADLDGGVGGYKNFRVKAEHSRSVTHISTSTTVVITFSSPIEAAVWEMGDANLSISGNTVTIVREYHANGYYSGDQYNSVLKVRAASDDLTLALTCSATISGVKIPNVQGGWD